jgi:coenzyme Q-binding protein COQ10
MEAERRLPYPPEALCSMVADVRRYPEFIPWIRELSVIEEASDEPVHQLVAHVVVGWKAIREQFATRVRRSLETLEVDVSLVQGPLKTLENRWRFLSDGEGGAIVRFFIAYDFKNPLFNAILNANRDRAISRIMGAFEAEAARRFGS